ncbi:hypothetical protein LINPERHAP1_LOCUS21025 [Linum perenne]
MIMETHNSNSCFKQRFRKDETFRKNDTLLSKPRLYVLISR